MTGKDNKKHGKKGEELDRRKSVTLGAAEQCCTALRFYESMNQCVEISAVPKIQFLAPRKQDVATLSPIVDGIKFH